MSMRKGWFEEVDGRTRFTDLYNLTNGGGIGIAHAFRTLLAEDAAAGKGINVRDMDTVIGAVNESVNRITTLERKVKRLRKRSKGYHADIVSLDQRLTPLEEFLDGVPAFGEAFEDIKQVAPEAETADGVDLATQVAAMRKYMHAAIDQRDASQAEVRRLEEQLANCNESNERTKNALNTTRQQRDLFWAQRDENIEKLADMEQDRDSLQAKLDDAEKANIFAGERIDDLNMAYNTKVYELDAANADIAAYRARVDAGKVVYASGTVWYNVPVDNYVATGRVIDVADIAPAVEPEPEVSANDRRTRDRRVLKENPYWDSSMRIRNGRRFSTTNERRADRRQA